MANKPASGNKAPPKAGTAVATPDADAKSLVLVQDQVPDHLKSAVGSGSKGRGNEGVGNDDLVIPRLEIVQALSPVVKEGDAAYNPQARPGMLINTVTKKLYGKETFVVPIQYTKQWLVWKARKDLKTGKPLEGGFFGAYNTPEEAADRQKKEGGVEGNIEVLDTPQHLCLLCDMTDGTVSEIMLSMPRTKAKKSREWNSMVKLAGGDRFSRVYRIGTVLEKNPKGDFYNFSIAQCGFPTKVLYDRAEKLYEAVKGGRTYRADTTDLGDDAGHGEGAGAEM